MAKGSNAEVEERVFTVAKLMLDGMQRTSDIFHYVSEKEKWNLSKRQVSNYIKEARNLIRAGRIEDIEFEKSLAIGQLNDLIRKNYDKEDFREVRNCIKDKAVLLGLIESRFAGKVDKKESKLTVVSRFADKWEKIKGG